MVQKLRICEYSVQRNERLSGKLSTHRRSEELERQLSGSVRRTLEEAGDFGTAGHFLPASPAHFASAFYLSALFTFTTTRGWRRRVGIRGDSKDCRKVE